ncbi:MAG TPA: hypothetical protein VM364_03150 [Vicinamibacterales bacterium]|nr:hypothetical protein [Vicinamibacterales bacterium]
MKLQRIALAVAVCLLTGTVAAAQSTLVPGHRKADRDGNGVADAGVNVNAHFTQTITWVSGGIEYSCTYVVNTRGDYGNDPYLNSGWIMNNVRCVGGGATAVFHYMIVHQSDPRYTGEGWPIWGTWEWFSLVESQLGNVARNGRTW